MEGRDEKQETIGDGERTTHLPLDVSLDTVALETVNKRETKQSASCLISFAGPDRWLPVSLSHLS